MVLVKYPKHCHETAYTAQWYMDYYYTIWSSSFSYIGLSLGTKKHKHFTSDFKAPDV